MWWISPILLLFLLSCSLSAQLRSDLRTFVRRAVPEGTIVFYGDAQTGDHIYDLFLLRQHERRGVFIVFQTDSSHAGFMFRSNSTVEILRELQESDAIPTDPMQAPIGAIPISPTFYSGNGPVLLGTVAILASDRRVYEPNFGKGGFWAPRETLNDWIKQNNSTRQVFGFLLRAHSAPVR
jgi:hypothetical protein